jgi:hypothetical protein
MMPGCDTTAGCVCGAPPMLYSAFDRYRFLEDGRIAGLEEAAKIVEDNTIRYSGDGDMSLQPRLPGDTNGIYYAAAIRAAKERT